jgi:hypothetical protein
MTTNPDKFAERHQQIIERAEREFAADRAKNPKVTVPKTVAKYAAAVRRAISCRDCIAAVYAVCAAHLAMKVDITSR